MAKMNSINVAIENVDDAIHKLNEARTEYQQVIDALRNSRAEMTQHWNGAAAVAFFNNFHLLISALEKNKQCAQDMAKEAKKEKDLLEDIKLQDSFFWG